MPDTELQLLKLDMEYTKKAVTELNYKVDSGFEKSAVEVAGLRKDFSSWMEKQEDMFRQLGDKRTEDIMTLVRDFDNKRKEDAESIDKKLELKPDRKESWGESAIKWFLVTLGVLIIGYAFKVIITAGTLVGLKL